MASRKEQLLLALLNGETVDMTPKSRKEQLLLALLNGETVDMAPKSRNSQLLLALLHGETVDIVPRSRTEQLLLALCEKGIGTREPVEFHVREGDKLFILGALSAASLQDGLYLDCSPDWEHPVLNDDVLTITQAYSTTLNGDILEVE